MKKQNDRSASRPSISRDVDENRSIDKRSASERLDESRSASSEDLSKDKMVSSPQRERSSNVTSDDVRDLNTIDRTASRQRESESSSEKGFEGQGGRPEKGTGKTSDRPSHLQDDDSLSGRPSRQDKSSSDRSSSLDRSSSSDSPSRSDRISEDKSSRDLDRSKM